MTCISLEIWRNIYLPWVHRLANFKWHLRRTKITFITWVAWILYRFHSNELKIKGIKIMLPINTKIENHKHLISSVYSLKQNNLVQTYILNKQTYKSQGLHIYTSGTFSCEEKWHELKGTYFWITTYVRLWYNKIKLGKQLRGTYNIDMFEINTNIFFSDLQLDLVMTSESLNKFVI